MRKGMTEAEADAAIADLPSCEVPSPGPLPPEQLAALRLVDVLTEPQTTQVDPALMAELGEHFTASQILELGTALAVASGWQRFIEAFGIRPDHWTEATPLPPRPEQGD